DGGLYAELVKNRSFEFPNSLVGWTPFGLVSIQDEDPCFDRNPHYVSITNDGRRLRAGIDNEGYRGIGLEAGKEYRLSAYVRTDEDRPMTLKAELVASNGYNGDYGVYMDVQGKGWHKITVNMTAPFTDAHSKLRILLESKGTVELDHISLFPVDTWKGRENGLRKDLAQALYDLKPGFFRFPGGCIIEGNSLDTRYEWKKSVGPVENRPLNENRWNHVFKHRAAPDYFQSTGMGFYEMFLLAEDLGATPLPVISCGMACQFESTEVVPVDELGPYIQDAIDLIEFANGSPDTQWGKVRAEMGHPEPFGMKYLAIGNEQWGPGYVERLEVFMKEIRKVHPEILLIGSSGPYPGDEHFKYLWPEMARLGADLVDEHYYQEPDWFWNNAGRYDSYDRKGPKVFAGEFASHDYSVNRDNSFLAALSEAAFMTGLERNADIVRLATYAPLFAHAEAWQWNPDLIWFNNLEVLRTANYYVQKMYSWNSGTEVLDITMNGKTIIGQDNLYASAAFDAKSGELVIKIVNSSDSAKTVEIALDGLKKKQNISGCRHIYLQHNDLSTVNAFGNEVISPKEKELPASGKTLNLTLEPYSFN
ncbi:MAG: carbohydrate binding domain-containing protein, partial [Bacteroidales bacterium]|nr:carbohydrate binding domain-containing protein [Bacteroidales bacterium]